MAKIKIGQIGIGHAHASGKMETYRKSEEYEVAGIVEPDPALHRRAQTGIYEGLPLLSLEQLLNTKDLQAVAIETPVSNLLEFAETCINAGMHIHLDKPAGQSLSQFRRILDTAARKHLLVQMGYMYRYNPGILLLRDFLKKGWLGAPFEVHTVMSKVIPAGGRAALAEYPGGIFFELGCHIVDLVVGLLGKPQEVASFRQHTSKHDDALVDNMLAVLTYPDAIASVKSSANEVEGFARRHLVLCGSEGTFHLQPLDNPSAQVAFSMPRGKFRRGYQEISLPKYTRYVDDASDMARIIRGEKPPDFTYQHDYDVQETLLKACGLPVDDRTPRESP